MGRDGCRYDDTKISRFAGIGKEMKNSIVWGGVVCCYDFTLTYTWSILEDYSVSEMIRRGMRWLSWRKQLRFVRIS